MQGAGCRVQGSGFRVQGSGFRVQGSGLKVQGSGLKVQGSGLWANARARPGRVVWDGVVSVVTAGRLIQSDNTYALSPQV